MKKLISLFAFISLVSFANAQTTDWLWAKNAGGTISSDWSNAVAIDASGNVYIAGYFTSPTIIFGTITLTDYAVGDVSNIFLAKYDDNGNVLWAKSAGRAGYDVANSVAVDASGNVYLAGGFTSDTIIFGTTSLVNYNPGNYDIFIAKYNTSGDVIWAKSAGAIEDEKANSVAVDANGNAYVTGFFDSPSIAFGTITLTNAGNDDIFLAKFDANGNVLWAKRAGGTYQDDAISVAVDVSGNAYIAGYFNGYCNNDTLIFGQDTLKDLNNEDVFLAKFDANGNALWGKSALGFEAYVTLDTSGNIYLTGRFGDSNTIFGADTLINKGLYNIYFAKYDANGNALWAKSAGGTTDDGALSVTTNSSGNIYITGYFDSPSITFGSTILTNADTSGNTPDIFLAKYDDTGNVLWAERTGGLNHDVANSAALDASGNIYLTGYFGSPTITFGTTTLTNTTNSDVFYDIFLAKSSSFTGIHELRNSFNYFVYPNPSTNNITIESPQDAVIEITNIQGQLVKTFTTTGNKTNIDVSALPSGVYVVEVKTAKGVAVSKFIKE
jgi:hypothetical protein